MDYDLFCDRITEIIEANLTPCLACGCGNRHWMYEGTFKHAYKMYREGCLRCGVESTLIGDPDAPDL